MSSAAAIGEYFGKMIELEQLIQNEVLPPDGGVTPLIKVLTGWTCSVRQFNDKRQYYVCGTLHVIISSTLRIILSKLGQTNWFLQKLGRGNLNIAKYQSITYLLDWHMKHFCLNCNTGNIRAGMTVDIRVNAWTKCSVT